MKLLRRSSKWIAHIHFYVLKTSKGKVRLASGYPDGTIHFPDAIVYFPFATLTFPLP
jgi:hypothetical protein